MMSNLSNPFDGSFYDADYFENGQVSGKGWLMNYRWMPRRSIKEALAFIDMLGLDENSYVLDFGCAKGFIVKALRMLEIKADGCDISDYALSFAPEGCWNCSSDSSWAERSKFEYTHIIMKDVLEHLTEQQLDDLLQKIKKISSTIMCVVPMGDNGKYRIPEYHTEISHLIAEDEKWWMKKFEQFDWQVFLHTPHVKGLKDNWQTYANGNHVFVLKNTNKDCIINHAWGFGFGGMEKSELTFIYDKCKDKKVLELGTEVGQSAYVIGMVAQNLTCVDIWDEAYQHLNHDEKQKLVYINAKKLHHNDLKNKNNIFSQFISNCKELITANKITYIKGNTQDVANEFEDKSFDVILFDADHSYQGVYNDIKKYISKLRDDGVLFFHDYGGYWDGVKMACDEAESNNLIKKTNQFERIAVFNKKLK